MARKKKAKRRRRDYRFLDGRKINHLVYIYDCNDRLFCLCGDGVMREVVQGDEYYAAIERDAAWKRWNLNREAALI